MKTTRMPQLHHFGIFFSAAVHLILFSVCPASSRIYETNDAVVIEVDDVMRSNLAVQPSIRLTRNQFGNPSPIPMAYAVNPYTGLYHHQQQPNIPFWPYPLYKPASRNASNVPATSPESRQQKIACGVGPPTPPPARKTPTVGIVGGTEAAPNSWPFIVGLRIFGQSFVLCAGSLISPTRILTAAHCVNELTAIDISKLTVSLGMHTQGNLPDTVNDAQQTRRITRVIYHKDFNKKTWVNDVAVLTIDPPVSYSSAISPVCLPPPSTAADQFAGKDSVIMGWGRSKTNPVEIPNALQEATIKIVTKEQCSQSYSSIGFSIFNQHICTGAAGKDICQGDSGGPLVVQTTAGDLTSWTQIGVVSFGRSCPADVNQPSVYSNVAFFRNWINNYMIH